MTKASNTLQRMAVPIKTFAESVAGLKRIPKKAESTRSNLYYNFVVGSPNFDLSVGNPVWLSHFPGVVSPQSCSFCDQMLDIDLLVHVVQ
jgi:hypothetical protein